MVAQGVQEYLRQPLLFHVCERVGVDPVVGLTGAQQFEKVDSALGRAALEPCKILVADVGHVTVGLNRYALDG